MRIIIEIVDEICARAQNWSTEEYKPRLALCAKINQKYQNGNIHRKLKGKGKAKGSNVRGVGTFFDTCSNLDQLSQLAILEYN
jgi:hypothetical protein